MSNRLHGTGRREPEPPPTTPDGRYIVVRGRLWRRSNPGLPPEERERLVHRLMEARRAVAVAGKAADPQALAAARRRVDEAKRGLGERGPPWWTDEAPDLNRHLARNTPYAAWFALHEASGKDGDRDRDGLDADDR
ncbi:MAG: hypothetical protein ABWY78_17550 [Microvirga sp.]